MATAVQTIIDELDASLDYEETNDVAKAKRVITLTKQLIARRPTSSSHSGSSNSWDINQLSVLQNQARAFVQSSTSSSGGNVLLNPSCDFRG